MRKKLISFALVGVLSCGVVSFAASNPNISTPFVQQEVSASTGTNSNQSSLSTQATKKPVKKDVKIKTIVAAVKKAYGKAYVPNVNYSKTEIEEKFGVKSSLYTEAIAQGPMISIHSDTFVAIKAKKGKGPAVETILKKYQSNLKKDTMQYPMNSLKIQGSRVDRFGDYVFFTLLGEIPKSVENKGDKAIIEAAKKQNLIAYNAIKKTLGK